MLSPSLPLSNCLARALRLPAWAALTLCWLVLAAGHPAAAHPGDEANVYHYLYLRLDQGEISVQHATVVGGLIAPAVWAEMDRDGNRELSEEEQETAARRLAASLRVEAGGTPLPLVLEAWEFPDHRAFFGSEGFPAARLLLTGRLPRPLPATLTVRDGTYSGYGGVFAEPELRRAEKAPRAAVSNVSPDGRTVTIVLGAAAAQVPARVSAAPSIAAPSVAAPAPGDASRLPGLRLLQPGEDPLAIPQGGKGASGTGAPGVQGLERTSPDPAAAFPERGKILYAAPATETAHAGEELHHAGDGHDHEEGTSVLRGLLGRRLGLFEILLGLGTALLLGAAHALEPGHGKAMVAAYLVGSRGTVRDAVFLGLVVTVTHTAGVYVLGFLCLWLTSHIRADVVAHWLSLTSGLLVFAMGFWLFHRGLLHYHGIRPLVTHTHSHAGEGHHLPEGHSHAAGAHHHAPTTAHAHAHAAPALGGGGPVAPAADPGGSSGEGRVPPPDAPVAGGGHHHGTSAAARAPLNRSERWGVIGLGLAGGIVPCYGALVLLIAAVNLGNVALGLLLIAAFSVGMAAVLVAVGVVMVKAQHWVTGLNREGPVVRALPAVSGAFLFVLGAFLTFQALAQTGVIRVGG